MTDARKTEQARYDFCYQNPNYRMGVQRLADARRDFLDLPDGLFSFLDVGCGRAEMLKFAEQCGYTRVQGAEVVDALVDGDRVVKMDGAHKLPFRDKFFDVVSMNDVIEHLVPGDDKLACKELQRVAQRHILLTANNRPSRSTDGSDLHINKRPYDEWHNLFVEWFDEGVVTKLWSDRQYISPGWRVDLAYG